MTPTVPEKVLDPAPLDAIKAMATVANARDRAVSPALADRGLRAPELVDLDRADFAPSDGALTVRRGQGRPGASHAPGRQGPAGPIAGRSGA